MNILNMVTVYSRSQDCVQQQTFRFEKQKNKRKHLFRKRIVINIVVD